MKVKDQKWGKVIVLEKSEAVDYNPKLVLKPVDSDFPTFTKITLMEK